MALATDLTAISWPITLLWSTSSKSSSFSLSDC
uniref:Chaperone clpb, putative n=1 Tax=Arundo donax TaxID=35708 RepID=A0A0A9DY22_ARUDO